MKINILSILTFFYVITLIGISGSEASAQDVNLALTANNPKVTAKQSSQNTWDFRIAGPATKAIDGDLEGGLGDQRIVETKSDDKDGWFEVDLGNYYKINKIVIHPRTDNCCTANFKPTVIVTDQPIDAKPVVDDAKVSYSSTYSEFSTAPISQKKVIDTKGSIGRYIRLQMKGSDQIELAEIEIFGDQTAVAAYTPNPAKAWNAVIVVPFDPNYPNYRGATGEYFTTLQGSPKIVGVKNSATGFDIAFQDNFGASKDIKVNSYEKDGSGFKKNKSTTLPGLGVFGGFAKDAAGNTYVFTGTPWSNREEPGDSKVFKNSDVLWEGKFSEAGTNNPFGKVRSFMHYGGSRLAVGGNSLLITTNFSPAHPYQVILDTTDKSKNDNRAFFESMYQHNFGQRAIYDGSDFVVMENRDHDVSVTLSKLNPAETLPLTKENKDHANEYVKRIFSVYSHTNFNNNTYTELGNVEKGLDDNGYLVLFASERDWDKKLDGYNYKEGKKAPDILSPRDLGLVHVKKDFNSGKVNWLDSKGLNTQCAPTVDNSNFVNSIGTGKTVKYSSLNDGWDWQNYSPACYTATTQGTMERTLVTKGVKWITNFGASYTQKAPANTEFTSVNHPKLVRIAPNTYIALWEEWTADYTIFTNNGKSFEFGRPTKTYLTTKAAKITLVNNSGQVEIQSSPIKDLGKIRLMPGDDAFEFNGKAAWAVGDSTKNKLMFYTVDGALNVASSELDN